MVLLYYKTVKYVRIHDHRSLPSSPSPHPFLSLFFFFSLSPPFPLVSIDRDDTNHAVEFNLFIHWRINVWSCETTPHDECIFSFGFKFLFVHRTSQGRCWWTKHTGWQRQERLAAKNKKNTQQRCFQCIEPPVPSFVFLVFNSRDILLVSFFVARSHILLFQLKNNLFFHDN